MGVYIIHKDDFGNFSLEKQNDAFIFDFKVYGLESDLIRRVEAYYKSSTGNLGILLNGVKGTGKTVTAKILANVLENPVVLIQRQTSGLIDFLNSIHQDITVLIDEYEKIFDGKYDSDLKKSTGDASLLGIMDGAIQSEYRRTWILTTNQLWLNENLLNRPGRIRYVKQYKDLNYDTIIEILDDELLRPAHKEAIIEYCKTLELITVDILKAIIREVNLFNDPPEKCCAIMNVSVKEDRYNFVMLKEGLVLMDRVSVAEMEAIKKKVREGKAGNCRINDFYHPTRKGELRFKKQLHDIDEYVYTWTYENKDGDDVEQEVVCGWKHEQFIHSAFLC